MDLLKKILGHRDSTKIKTDQMIYSPLIGKVVALSEVNDPVFSQEMMGKGVAVVPSVGRVVAPCDGKIINVFRTRHAVLIKADNGAEIIIHVGLETVALNGKHYQSHVEDEMQVKKGDLLLTFDLDEIKQLGYDLITPIIVSNSADYQSVESTKKNEVKHGDVLINLVK